MKCEHGIVIGLLCPMCIAEKPNGAFPASSCSPEFTDEIRDYLTQKGNEYGVKAKEHFQPDSKNYRDMSWAFRFVQEIWNNEENAQEHPASES
tara:strand:+ start:10051 stop:10329 length:279 start_codon:yes stop_codon:yes gene_type:complete